jgi:hypothetical protein
MRSLLLATLAGVLGLFTWFDDARAEAGMAPPRCTGAAAPLRTVPANIPAVVAFPTGTTITSFALSNVQPALANTFESQTDPRYGGARLFVPSAPLPVGQKLTLTFDVTCSGGLASSMDATFDTVETVALPTQIGVAKMQPRGATDGDVIELQPTDALAKFLPVTMFELRARGATAALGVYGGAHFQDGRVLIGVPPSMLAVLPVCAPGEVSSKSERMDLAAHIAGATSDPEPVTIDVPITCGASATQPPSDAGVDDAVDDTGGGCTLSAQRSEARSVSSALMLMLALVIARRATREA